MSVLRSIALVGVGIAAVVSAGFLVMALFYRTVDIILHVLDGRRHR